MIASAPTTIFQMSRVHRIVRTGGTITLSRRESLRTLSHADALLLEQDGIITIKSRWFGLLRSAQLTPEAAAWARKHPEAEITGRLSHTLAA
ncbi:hypothetical protein F1643_21050 [Azospirillum sp. INR13]|uniref:hypothetical protein n=1 Tax=Azospirillum sp. INR13 TaxID=2596919 RepID=UPI001892667E|nr:hypothetical protein [Azospirillum sp. INR13]MBF5096488.1 hypothetical protein [Azospirillum sp. INR13]